MDPTQLIENLCRRHGVPRAFGEKLRPLLRRAQRAEPDARQRILDLVARSFEEESRRCRDEERATQRMQALPETDRKILQTVASVLHGWAPPAWLTGWGKRQSDETA